MPGSQTSLNPPLALKGRCLRTVAFRPFRAGDGWGGLRFPALKRRAIQISPFQGVRDTITD
jgi:hypothetical protein